METIDCSVTRIGNFKNFIRSHQHGNKICLRVMACTTRISLFLSRSITTGDFYTGLKFLKISTSPSDQACPTTSSVCLPTVTTFGCRTTSRQTVKIVAISNRQVPLRRTSNGNFSRTIIPILHNGNSGEYSRGAPLNPRRTYAGIARYWPPSSFEWHRDRQQWNIVGPVAARRIIVRRAAADDKPGDSSGSSGGDKPPIPPGGSPIAPNLAKFTTGGNKSADSSGTTGVPPAAGGGGSSGTVAPPPTGGGTPPAAPGGSSVPPDMGGPTGGAPVSPLVRPPIQFGGMKGAYAGALYSAASKQNKLEVVEQDLIKIRDTFANDTKLREFLLAPNTKMSLKMEAIGAFKQLGINDISYNFLVTMTENKRLKLLPAVISAYIEMITVHRGVVKCAIISARPMKPAQKEKLMQILTKFLPGKTAETVEQVDPGLIGGFILLVGQQHINMTMLKQFNTYEKLIRAPA